MDTYAFVQGMLAVVALATVFGMVWALVEVNFLKKANATLKTYINDLEFALQARMDRELQGVEISISDLYREMDSRFDKFEDRLSKKILLKG